MEILRVFNSHYYFYAVHNYISGNTRGNAINSIHTNNLDTALTWYKNPSHHFNKVGYSGLFMAIGI